MMLALELDAVPIVMSEPSEPRTFWRLPKTIAVEPSRALRSSPTNACFCVASPPSSFGRRSTSGVPAAIDGTTTEAAGVASEVALASGAPVDAAGLGVLATAEAGCWLEVAGLLQAARAAARMRPLPVRSAARVDMGMVVGILETMEGAGMAPGSGNPSYATMAGADENA
jgi:hypothetical protein